ncbi:unnamed protein product [Phaedon cochleariae]|uniref:C2H2-type domain-containing protein n=1 Tax=Phaedon cochleariae TaxID=80249 RepID=A0A9N9SFP9_PHACE|nr:unnamed protein product [Phaedon cochleariae]
MDMTAILQNDESEEVQYILNDAEFVLEPSDVKTEGTNDVVYTDGSQTYLINSNIIRSDEQTLVLQEGDNIGQLLVNNEIGQILVVGDQLSTENHLINDSTYVQYVVEDGNDVEPSEILYVSEDSTTNEHEDEESSLQQLEYENICSFDELQLAQSQVIDLEELFQQDGNITDQQNGYQYAILKNGKLHIQTCAAEPADTSLITGKNLITGQTVSLESYINKHQSSVVQSTVKSGSRSQRGKLNGLLNRTFRLGASVNGKQLVGKVVQVKTNVEKGGCLQGNHSAAAKAGGSKSKAHSITSFQQLTDSLKSAVNQNSEIFHLLSRTLTDLMDVEDIKAKLLGKKLFVMMDRKSQANKKTLSKKVYYSGGTVQPNDVPTEDDPQKWKFVADFLTRDYSVGGGMRDCLKRMFLNGKYPDVVKLTLKVTNEKNNKRQIRVVIEPETHCCSKCADAFSTVDELTDHVVRAHGASGNLGNSGPLGEHTKRRQAAIGRGDRVFPCDFVGCGQCFDTDNLRLRHFQTHHAAEANSSPDDPLTISNYQCAICPKAFSSVWNLNAHKKSHGPNKVFGCDLCKRTFTRCSNLQRHLAVHHQGSGEMHQCKICGCSYHYVSSLTRHVVQNHLQRQEMNVDMKGT